MMEKSINQSLYVVLISIHGLIRGRDLELGRDTDTGGQTKYVVELTRALAKQPGVERVDLVTRMIANGEISPDYAAETEPLSDKAQIVRIEAGPSGYIHKEDLWDHLDSFADNLLVWLHRQPRMPDVLHSHYADAGYVGVLLSRQTGLPLIHTGHSLGRDKSRRLLAMGLTIEDIQSRFHMQQRVNAEEETLNHADLVITSTRNEIEEQYELYDCYTPEKMVIIPPGINLGQFYPPMSTTENFAFGETLKRFLRDSGKPIILAISRPDIRKNIITLLDAYGETKRLRQLANLVIVAGNREDIKEMDEDSQAVLTEILLEVDRLDLYGKVALPKQHKADDVAGIYRMATASKGVFINPALTEPFGLTLLEAAASGLPFVATENGGPVDIVSNCNNGLLVDPLDKAAIGDALLEILENPERWRTFSQNGLENVAKLYSWDAHAKSYLELVQPLCEYREPPPRTPLAIKSKHYRNCALFSDIDQNLLGDLEGLEKLAHCIVRHRKQFIFGIATGRRLDSALAILKKYRIPMPDILISSLGTEIYFAPDLIADSTWTQHIDHLWTPQVLRRLIGRLPGLHLQDKGEQSQYKLSYGYDAAIAPPLEDILSMLRQRELAVNPILSFGQYFDLIPSRASKGQALRYVAQQWRIPLERILVAGGSGADEDMLRGNTLGVVVANRHREELAKLGETERIYFAAQPYAWGILEAIDHYDFFNL